MTRFEELNELFKPWREEWINQYHQHQTLPFAIAAAFREFLGCPESFSMSGEKPFPYVSPCIATRSLEDNNFNSL